MDIVSWLNYIDSTGYIDFDKFMEQPGQLLSYVLAIRKAQELKDLKRQRDESSGKEVKASLSKQIIETERYFNE